MSEKLHAFWQKTNALYFKIYGLYFEICALYFFACPEACFSAQLTLMLYATNIEFSWEVIYTTTHSRNVVKREKSKLPHHESCVIGLQYH